MSISHFNADAVSKGFSPCGKNLRRCNWTTGRDFVTCSTCRMAIDRADEIEALHRHIGQLENENHELRQALREVEQPLELPVRRERVG